MDKKTKYLLMVLLFLSIVVPLVITGCASIASGSTQKVNISTKPEGAEVRIFDESNREIWNSNSPISVTLNRGAGFFKGASYRLEISKEGYEKETVFINASLNGGWYIAGNFFIGGLLGWLIIDPATGAMWTLNPENVNISLEEGSAAKLHREKDALMIVLAESIDKDLFEKLSAHRIK